MVTGNDHWLDAGGDGKDHRLPDARPDAVGKGEYTERQPLATLQAACQEQQPFAGLGAAFDKVVPGSAFGR